MIGKILRLEGGMIVVPLERQIGGFRCIIIHYPADPRLTGLGRTVSEGLIESAVEYKLFGRSQRRGKLLMPNLLATGYGPGLKSYERFSIETEWVEVEN